MNKNSRAKKQEILDKNKGAVRLSHVGKGKVAASSVKNPTGPSLMEQCQFFYGPWWKGNK